MPKLTIRHVTTYHYRQPVAFGEHRMMLRPRASRSPRACASFRAHSVIMWVYDFAPLGLAQFDPIAYIHLCLLVRSTAEQLNRMARVSRAAKNFTPKQGQYLAFIYAYTRLHRSSGRASSGDNQGSLAASKCSLIRSACQSYANTRTNQSKSLCSGTSCGELAFRSNRPDSRSGTSCLGTRKCLV
jgi:hypothetical protein